MPFLPPNQQRQSTEGKSTEGKIANLTINNKSQLYNKLTKIARISTTTTQPFWQFSLIEAFIEEET